MAEDHEDGDGEVAPNPKTPSELKRAREDAKQAREDRDQARRDLTAARSELTKTRNELEGQIETLSKQHATELEKIKIDLGAKASAAEKSAEDAKASAQQRVMMADLRMTAKDSGMHDLDALKLLDMSEAKLDDDGNLTNAADMLEAMKLNKPYLFSTVKPGIVTGTTTSTATPPVRTPATGFDARKATKEEYAARVAELTGRTGASMTQFSVRNT